MPGWVGSSTEASPAQVGATSQGDGAAGGEASLFVVENVGDLFDRDKMREMVGRPIEGAGSGVLNEAMEELAGNPSDERAQELLRTIATERGAELTPEQAQEQYEKFKEVRDAAERAASAKGEEIPQINEFAHGEFLGSTASLRFGEVVGEAFGLDPVFGAMLSPTGGMVGPGNWAYEPGDNDPTGYHGIFHDAAGYLYNYHVEEGSDGKLKNAGPGYDYLEVETDQYGRETDSPLAGQQSGMRFWHEELNPGPATDVKLFAVDVVATTYDGAVAAYDYASEGAAAVYDAVSDGAGVVYDTAADAVEWVGDGLASAGDAVYDTVDAGYEYASDKVSGAVDFFSGLFD